MLEKIAILFFELDGQLSLDSIRVIAGPSTSREETVKLANSFIDKRYTTLIE